MCEVVLNRDVHNWHKAAPHAKHHGGAWFPFPFGQGVPVKGVKHCSDAALPGVLVADRVVWFKSFDLNHWFKSWFKSLQKNQKNHVFLIFLIFINILSIIINILLIFNDKFDFFFKYILCVCLLFCNHVKQL